MSWLTVKRSDIEDVYRHSYLTAKTEQDYIVPFVCDIQHKNKLIQIVFYLDYVPFPLGDKGSCEKEGY